MGRKPKQGIDYFPADVDMFQDRKIKRLLRAAGGKGFTIYIYLLTHIYRDNGYFLEWDYNLAFDVADDLNFPESVVEEAVNVCCAHGLFNKEMFTDMGVLTSESIQQRWQKIVTDAKRVDTEINPEYLIEDGKCVFLMEETEFPTEETRKTLEETPQSKVKESKVNTPPPRAQAREGFNPGIIDPPDSPEKVKEIGSMKGIPPDECEMYFEMRSVDNFMRMSKDSIWKPIPNWHADLAHCHRKGYLTKKKQKSKRNGGSNGSDRKSKGDRHVEALQSL